MKTQEQLKRDIEARIDYLSDSLICFKMAALVAEPHSVQHNLVAFTRNEIRFLSGLIGKEYKEKQLAVDEMQTEFKRIAHERDRG